MEEKVLHQRLLPILIPRRWVISSHLQYYLLHLPKTRHKGHCVRGGSHADGDGAGTRLKYGGCCQQGQKNPFILSRHPSLSSFSLSFLLPQHLIKVSVANLLVPRKKRRRVFLAGTSSFLSFHRVHTQRRRRRGARKNNLHELERREGWHEYFCSIFCTSLGVRSSTSSN